MHKFSLAYHGQWCGNPGNVWLFTDILPYSVIPLPSCRNNTSYNFKSFIYLWSRSSLEISTHLTCNRHPQAASGSPSTATHGPWRHQWTLYSATGTPDPCLSPLPRRTHTPKRPLDTHLFASTTRGVSYSSDVVPLSYHPSTGDDRSSSSTIFTPSAAFSNDLLIASYNIDFSNPRARHASRKKHTSS